MQQFPFTVLCRYIEQNTGAAPCPVISNFGSLAGQHRGRKRWSQILVIDNFYPGASVPGPGRVRDGNI